MPDELLVTRRGAIQSEAVVAGVVEELADARLAGNESQVAEICDLYIYQMHNLSEFMKALLLRFTRWLNGTHERSATLWEERFKSVIVENGIDSRRSATMERGNCAETGPRRRACFGV